MQRFGTEQLQYVYSPWHKPVGRVAPGEPFEIETSDCFTGRFHDPANFNDESAAWVEDNLNPVTGPIWVAGAVAGGALEVRIASLEITTPGMVVISRCEARAPLKWWHEEDHSVTVPIADGMIHLRDGWSVPVRPLIGCLATAPKREAILSRREGAYGGNMDCGEITAGATVLLPVEVDGGLLYFGDCKAAMGDGEIVAAPECGTRIVASATPVERPKDLEGVRVWSDSYLTTIISGVSLADAARDAFRQLKLWLESDYELSNEEASVIMGIGAHCGIAQVSNAILTAKCSIARDLLPAP